MPQKKYDTSLFIFRRDLRLNDNTALLKALKESTTVIPIFIFDPRQVGPQNTYRSSNCIQFMCESLEDLAHQIKKKKGTISLFKEKAETVVAKIIKQKQVNALFLNTDYTPFSLERDAAIKKQCIKAHVDFISCNDALLNAPENIATKNNTPYEVFTPFFKKCRSIPVRSPKKCTQNNFFSGVISGSDHTLITTMNKHKNESLWQHGGSTRAKKILTQLPPLKRYATTRNLPDMLTSNLSAHNKFGTVSIRSVYAAIARALGKSSELIKQLYWRDFYYHVAYHSPFVFGSSYKKKYNTIQWSKSKQAFKKWCTGTTGFPIVDAGMRQLNKTGYMHNRCRMIVASFLVKDLHLNWLWGEKYFAQNLVDFDPCVNNGNWQWAASTGCDAQPYFRIFNPWIQQKKFDPDCTYIKKWIPELQEVPSRIIHGWYKEKAPPLAHYPRPMINHALASKKAITLFKKQKS